MTGAEELRALQSRIEAATGADRELDAAIVALMKEDTVLSSKSTGFVINASGVHVSYENPDFGSHVAWGCIPQYTGSLDEVVKLVGNQFDWKARWKIESFHEHPAALVAIPDASSPSGWTAYTAAGAKPELAICAALLRALIARAEKEKGDG